MAKTTEIKFTVKLDENNVPLNIEWEADDSGAKSVKECSSLMISLWDKNEKVTLGLDIWTPELLIDDMNINFHQTFIKMADTYNRATKNREVADLINDFSAAFADKLNLIKKS